ncbi:MAG: preprotein translocase subunit SecE [Eubacterium sp.]|nr:preprotein translocase subunit SecE [Candidatus Colimonas fimequi]
MDKGSNEIKSTTIEKKAEQTSQAKPKKEKKESGIVSYFRGVKLEMKKVVWPTQKELGSYTAVVLATCIAFALLFWGVDTGVLAAIKAVCF